MSREDFDRYERESVMRASGPYRGPGDDGAQRIIRNSERRRAARKAKQKAGVKV
ncbi:hypothetical protein N3K64_04650 [Escherichia coli]|uniref:hypothetical protein n=1 Tax=Escherichia coli TaxID=562 RepID=UPI0021C0C343|nr:hypothetical protein [Escherichia coli]MCT9829179.1 hypothetical protein [Escherichia coli]